MAQLDNTTMHDRAGAVYATVPEAVGIFLLPGAAQGFAIWYLVESGMDGAPGVGLIALLMAVLAVPVAHVLTTTRGRRLAALAYAVILGAVIAGLYLLAAASFGADLALEGPLTAICAACSIIIAYISAPFFRTVAERGERPTHYPSLFEFAWNLPVVGAAGALFTGALWIVLAIWAALFDLIGIDFFADLFFHEATVCVVSFAAFGVAAGIVRQREAIILALRGVLFALLKLLAPVLAVATILFAAAALVQGLDDLWADWSATSVMVAAIAGALVLSNAVIGEAGTPENPVLRWAVRGQALVLPVLAGFAVYGLWLRIHDYGLTVERIYAAIIVAIAAAYAIAYFIFAVLPRGHAYLRQANIALAGAIFAIAIVVQTPLFNAWEWSARDQVDRLEAGTVSPQQFDYAYLRFDLGPAGERALDRIAADESLPDHAYIVEQVAAVREAESRYAFEPEMRLTGSRLEAAIDSGRLLVLPEGAMLGEDFLPHLQQQLRGAACLDESQPDARCAVLVTDAFDAPSPQYVLATGYQNAVSLNLHVKLDEDTVEWTTIGIDMALDLDQAALFAALEAGDAEIATRQVRTLRIGGADMLLQPWDARQTDIVLVPEAAPN